VVRWLCESVAPDWGEEDMTMTRRRHTPDQIIRKLAEGNKLLAVAPSSTRCVDILRSRSRRGIDGSRSSVA